MEVQQLDKWLNRILKNIANVLHRVKPLVLWSGHGYHIIIPVKATEALEQFEDFESYASESSKEFLQFAPRYLSLNKADDKNNPAFGSCLLRVPHTLNSKCLDEKVDPEVKIIHEWNNSEQLPQIDNLLVEFQTFLVDRKLKVEINQNIMKVNYLNYSPNRISYVEKLLNIPIVDHRKFTISLILAPYFVNIQHQSDSESFGKIKQWALNCNEIESLKPSIEYFEDLIKTSLERVKKTRIKPLKFEETLRYKNMELYNILKSCLISIPGEYVKELSFKLIDAGIHQQIFSDHIPIES
ncbi:MAG: DNA primase noncatalytic subunit PriX [Nitrososphaeraceae archaeon]